jgi:hypothetical protein
MTKTIYAPGEYYHIYNRGVNRQPIFFAQHNWGFFIHRNPVDARLVVSPAKWVFSSYQDYIGLRNGNLPKPDIVLSQFASMADYRAYVEDQDEDDKTIEHLLFD